MVIQLQCHRCQNAIQERLDQLSAEGPWSALGDGETVEDHLFATLSGPEDTACPECGGVFKISQESLGRLTQCLLAQW